MTLFFTPVKGKDAFITGWTNTKLTEEQARSIPGATGVAIVHGLSNTVAFDFDDLAWCIKIFAEEGINVEEVIEGHFEIVSPKVNRRKIIFQAPGVPLEYLNLPPKEKGSRLELRCGNRYDVWYDSEHPEGGQYIHKGSKEILPLPDCLLQFWQQCLANRDEEQKVSGGTGLVPLVDPAGKMSVIRLFNILHPLEDVLKECGYKQKGKKWQSPHSTSGAYGLTCQMSYLNPWNVCYSHHASDGELSGRPIDAFEIAAAYAYPDKEVFTAKLIFTADQAEKLMAIDPDTLLPLSVSVNKYNNPDQAPANLLDLIDKIDADDLSKVPEFTEDIISSLPDPIPLLLYNFKQCIYEPVPAMFGPAFMALHETLLRAKIRTIRDRSVNCSYANGSLSGGGKDDNSIEAANRYLKEYQNHNLINNSTANVITKKLLSPITATFTSGTNLMQTLHGTKLEGSDGGPLGGVIMSAEATSFYRTLADVKNHYSGNAIIDVEIACFNGQLISAAKVTSDTNKHQKDILSPNFSFFRLTQLDPFKQAFNQNLVEKGYYGRLFETYDVREDNEYKASGNINNKVFEFDTEGFDFLLDMSTRLEILQDNIQVKCNQPGGAIHKWECDVIGKQVYPKIETYLFPGIKRIPQIAEKWVAFITSYNYFWNLYKGNDVSHMVLKTNQAGEPVELDGRPFEPAVLKMVDYLVDVKWHTLHTFIVNSDASELDTVFESLWHSCVKLTLPDAKRGATYGNWLRVGLVPLHMFFDKVKKKKEISRILGNDIEKINRLTDAWIRNKGLKVSQGMLGHSGSKKKTCLIEKK